MRKKVIALVLSVLFMFSFSACGEKKSRYEAEFIGLFDTLTKIVAYSKSKDEFTKQAQLIRDSLEEYHQLYDIYNDYEGINNLKTINDNAGIAPVKVDQRIIDLIRFSLDCYEMTNGKVNIAYGAVLKLWHDYREEGTENPEQAQLPPEDMLREAAKHTDINKIIINEKESTVYLEDPDMRLDVGAIAKGYATEQVCRIAVENGFTSGLISVGGNVRAISGKVLENEKVSPWIVGIQNPDLESEKTNIQNVEIIDMSLVTSGIYERYYTVNGELYHHIIDPQTLYPADYFLSVSIMCRDSGLADALSTAVFNMPFEQGLEFINGIDGVEAFWVLKNGELRYSENFRDFLSKMH